MEIFKSHLDKVLGSLLWVAQIEQEGWTRWSLEAHANLSQSVFLQIRFQDFQQKG